MSDLIERQAAIDAIHCDITVTGRQNAELVAATIGAFADRIKALPSAQPERLTDDDFETIRIHLNAYKEKLCNQHRWEEANEYQRIIDRFMAFTSAQPKTEERMEKSAQNVSKGDLVSRKGAIDAIERNAYRHTYIDQIVDVIKQLPSVQPERKKGKWIVYYECPKCGEITKDFTEYCPFCSADMRGGQDG